MKIYATIVVVCLLLGATLYHYFAPRPLPVDRIISKIEYVERTQTLTKTKWMNKDGTIVEQEKTEEALVSSKEDKSEAIHVVDKFRPKMYEVGVFREFTSNKYKIMGAVQLGNLPFKLGGVADVDDIHHLPSFSIGVVYAF